MALVKQLLQVDELELQLELKDGALRAISLPKEIPAKLDAATLKKVVQSLKGYKLLLDHATPFTRRVWAAMRKIPAGKTMSYSDLAAAIERPRAMRAVGSAVGRNALLILLPCHRVVGKNGLGGFGAGLAWKRKLLELEGA